MFQAKERTICLSNVLLLPALSVDLKVQILIVMIRNKLKHALDVNLLQFCAIITSSSDIFQKASHITHLGSL
jgi:hypothetical protein